MPRRRKCDVRGKSILVEHGANKEFRLRTKFDRLQQNDKVSPYWTPPTASRPACFPRARELKAGAPRYVFMASCGNTHPTGLLLPHIITPEPFGCNIFAWLLFLSFHFPISAKACCVSAQRINGRRDDRLQPIKTHLLYSKWFSLYFTILQPRSLVSPCGGTTRSHQVSIISFSSGL